MSLWTNIPCRNTQHNSWVSRVYIHKLTNNLFNNWVRIPLLKWTNTLFHNRVHIPQLEWIETLLVSSELNSISMIYQKDLNSIMIWIIIIKSMMQSKDRKEHILMMINILLMINKIKKDKSNINRIELNKTQKIIMQNRMNNLQQTININI